MKGKINYKVIDGIAVLEVDNPPVNPLSDGVRHGLVESMEKAESDDSVVGIVLTGKGRTFIAGADIKELANLSMEEAYKISDSGHKILSQTIEKCSKPIIAAINGYALGGGLEIALACHIRVASNNAKMGLPESSLGLIPGYGGTQRLSQLIGKGRAMEMIMTARMINADEAYNYGLINYKVNQEDLDSFTLKLASKILLNSSNAIKNAIKSVNAKYDVGVNGFNVEINEFSKCFETKDFIEGTTAFLNKRKPNFN